MATFFNDGGNDIGVHGRSNPNTGVFGQSTGGFGVHGQSNTNLGVHGRCLGNNTGMFGLSAGGFGVHGESSTNIGVHGRCLGNNTGMFGRSTGGFGVHGQSDTNIGVHGRCLGNNTGMFGSSAGGFGVHGQSDTNIGVHGRCLGNNTGVFGLSAGGFGVHGATTNSRAVFGDDPGENGVGVWGTSQNGVGVLGESDNGTSGRFEGFVEILGDLRVDGDKAFRIDHPLDPENKYLLHNAVESSERKNVYDGVAQLDEDGAAWVDLPEWFEALNGHFRYQLTSIGGAAPNLHVAEEVSESRFKIAGGEAGMKACWQVTGSRKDAWAAAHPFEVEQEKPEEERGLYLEPSLYGAPEDLSVIAARTDNGAHG